MGKKKSKRKWNRVHYFRRKKSTQHKVGHPVFVYETSGRESKYLVFTHTPENSSDYVELKHNIDPDEDGRRLTYLKKKFEITDSSHLRDPDKKYRIHSEDSETIKKYKK